MYILYNTFVHVRYTSGFDETFHVASMDQWNARVHDATLIDSDSARPRVRECVHRERSFHHITSRAFVVVVNLKSYNQTEVLREKETEE